MRNPPTAIDPAHVLEEYVNSSRGDVEGSEVYRACFFFLVHLQTMGIPKTNMVSSYYQQRRSVY